MKFSVKLKVYDEFTSKYIGVTLLVSVVANNQYEARKIAKNQYDYVLRGSPAFTFHNGRT